LGQIFLGTLVETAAEIFGMNEFRIINTSRTAQTALHHLGASFGAPIALGIWLFPVKLSQPANAK